MCICIYFPRKIINSVHYLAISVTVFLLLLTLTPLGIDVNGASRWLPFFGFSLQPMEFARIALVLYLSYFLSTHQHLGRTFSKGVIPPFAITGILCLLLLLQPDFGAAIILLAILFFLCLAGGTRFIYLALSFSMMTTLAVSLIMNSPYRMRRLLAFIDPFKDAQGTGYQLVQSFYALAEGSFLGVGMGERTAKTALSARSAQRLHCFRHRRGTRTPRHHNHDEFIHDYFCALLQNCHRTKGTA